MRHRWHELFDTAHTGHGDAAYPFLHAQSATNVLYRKIFADLQPGMEIAEDVRSGGGALLLARGHEVTELLLERIGGLPADVKHLNVKVVAPAPPAVADAA